MGFSREVVALIGVPPQADTDQVMRVVGEYVRVVRGDGGGGRRSFSAGVSRPFASVASLPQAYDEALSAVTVGRQMHGDEEDLARCAELLADRDQLRDRLELLAERRAGRE